MVNAAIILAGGTGERFGAEIPKQFISLNGKPVIQWTIEIFKSYPKIDDIIVVCNPEWMSEVKKIYNNVILAEAGKTRQESSRSGILACREETEYVIVHDAVRPLLDHKVLDRCFAKLEEGNHAVLTVIPSTDTLVSVDKDKVIRMENRNIIYRAQTPQCFKYKVLKKAHLNAKDNTATDDGRLVLEQGIELVTVPGNERNIKITTYADLYTAERLMNIKEIKQQNNIDLSGKTAIVFGGTSGIGKSCAKALEESGAKVIAVGSKQCDIRNVEEIKNLFTKVGHFDILINSARILVPSKIMDTNEQIISDTINTNLIGVINTCRLAPRYMKKGGHIINIGSSSAYRGRAGYALYSASKAALVNFSQALATEYEDYGISVNVISPPRTRTRMYLDLHPNVNPESLYDPDEVAKVVLRYCTGTENGHVVDLKISQIVKADPVEKKWS
ncbi:MAG: 2-C-methyl-D-erythritol 4-phosphate cytidylyltransferase [Candidatus Heimdallarchaeaceae archaeon]